MANQYKLGETVYLKRNINGQDMYQAQEWAGNVPWGWEDVGKQGYISGLQNRIAEGQKTIIQYNNGPSPSGYNQNVLAQDQKLLSEAMGNTGINAQGYVAPGFEKFNPYGMPDEKNYTPEERARQMNIPTAYGGLGANQPGQLPVAGTPAGTPPAQGGATTQSQPNGIGTTPTGTPAPASTYQGVSVTDYLNSVGQPSDFASRSAIAQKLGIQNYTGTAEQNTQMLNTLRSSQNANTGANGAINGGVNSGNNQQQQDLQTKISQLQQEVANATNAGYGAGGANAGKDVPADILNPPASNSPKDFIATYNDVMAQLGVSSIKTAYDKAVNDYAALQNEQNDKMQNILNDPWMSQNVKDRAITQIKNSYTTKLDILTNQQKLYDSLYQEGIAEAKYLTTGEVAQAKDLADIAQKKADALSKLDTSITEVNGYKVLVNNQTGEIVKTLGKSTSPSTKVTDSDIKSAIDGQLQSNNSYGSDKKVSWETYLWMNQNWINNGGKQSSFMLNYPINTYLDANNQKDYQKNAGDYLTQANKAETSAQAISNLLNP